ncbi:MAG: alpha/beta hydrolase-fold protein [Pseudomonadota bacterium]
MPGRIDTLTIDSAALAANPLGDPARRHVPVWLPPSYDDDAAGASGGGAGRRFPVIYWLAGFTSTGASLFQDNPWQPGLGRRLDDLVSSGAMGEVIVVAPDCFTRFGGSQYLDSPASGLYETHLCRELVPEVDRRYRTQATRDSRGIGGKSSGGFGALVLAMRNPDLFAAVASHAGDAYFELSVLGLIPATVRALRRHGGVQPFLRQFEDKASKRAEDIETMSMLALCAAYAPDPALPDGFALPFDPDTGEIVEATWRRFKAWDPVEMVNEHGAALRRMRLVYLDAGTRDEWALDLGARILAQRLRRLDVAVDHQEFDDGHRNTSYRYVVSLPKMAAALGAVPGMAAARAPS